MSLERLRASQTGRRAGLAVLRMLGVMTVLVLLVLPKGGVAAATIPAASPAARNLGDLSNLGDRIASSGWGDLAAGHADEDGACEEIEPEELLECGVQYDDMLDQPIVLSLLRALGVRMTADACEELLADLWAEQVCEAGSLECGRMNAGVPPGPPIKLVSSSASGHASLANALMLGMPGTGSSALADQARAFDSRDLQPPVPPPR